MTRGASIECFLAICRHKTVSKAAQHLYITQSSLSIRLKTLESELGGTLFFRKNGSREMALTPAGKKLYALALQYEEIVSQMQQVCAPHATPLRVSAINSLGAYLLPEVYEYFLQNHPQYSLEIQDMERESAESSLQSGLTDLAFTSGKTTHSGLLQTPVFCEPMVLLCGPKLSRTAPIDTAALTECKEAYIEWSRPFALWHQEQFPHTTPQISVSIMAQLEQFMKKGDYWSIVPISVAEGLSKTCKVNILDTSFPLPEREISVLTATTHPGDAIRQFLQCLHTVLGAHPALRSLL